MNLAKVKISCERDTGGGRSGMHARRQSRSRLSEQILRVDKWSLCRD